MRPQSGRQLPGVWAFWWFSFHLPSGPMEGVQHINHLARRCISSAITVKTRKLGIFSTGTYPQLREDPIFLISTWPLLTLTVCTCAQGKNSCFLLIPCRLMLNGAKVSVCPALSEERARGTSTCVTPLATAGPSSATFFVRLFNFIW